MVLFQCNFEFHGHRTQDSVSTMDKNWLDESVQRNQVKVTEEGDFIAKMRC
jgi:hypothetical protein